MPGAAHPPTYPGTSNRQDRRPAHARPRARARAPSSSSLRPPTTPPAHSKTDDHESVAQRRPRNAPPAIAWRRRMPPPAPSRRTDGLRPIPSRRADCALRSRCASRRQAEARENRSRCQAPSSAGGSTQTDERVSPGAAPRATANDPADRLRNPIALECLRS